MINMVAEHYGILLHDLHAPNTLGLLRSLMELRLAT